MRRVRTYATPQSITTPPIHNHAPLHNHAPIHNRSPFDSINALLQAQRQGGRYKRRQQQAKLGNNTGTSPYGGEKSFPVGNPSSGYYMYNDTDDMTMGGGGGGGNYQFQQYPR